MTTNSSTTVAAASSPDSTVVKRQSRLYQMGYFCAVHPLAVIAVWIVLLGAAVVSAGYFTSHLTGNNNVVNGSDSLAAARLIEDDFAAAPSETDVVVLHSPSLTVRDAAFSNTINRVVERYQASPLVAGVDSPLSAPQQLISVNGHTALVAVSVNGSDKELQEAAGPLGELAQGLGTGDIEVYFTGSSPLAAAGVEQGGADLAKAESIGLPAAAIVLLLAFGSVIAAAIPLALGVVTVLGALGALGVVSFFTPFDVFVQTAVSMVSIALGIDYSLFVVTRFREELARVGGGVDRVRRAQAVGATMATAGSAVLFSGTTVVVALVGLWLVRSPKVASMAMGMTAAVLVMMLIAVTLLPALLGLLGGWINRLALPWARRSLTHPDPHTSMWARLTAMVMRRPVLVAGTATLLLAGLSLPVFGLRYGVDLAASAVADSPAGRGYDVVAREFAPGVLAPISVVVSNETGPLNDTQLSAISQFTAVTMADFAVADATSITVVLDVRAQGHTSAQLRAALDSANGELDNFVTNDARSAVVTVRPRHAADSEQTAQLVDDLRKRSQDVFAPLGLTSHVGGAPAEIVDITNESSRAMPIVIGAVLAASWLLLLLAFRSLALPFKAIFMNLLTSGAAFGAAVLIFQEGYGADLFGVGRTGFIQVILPLFAFALVFGLSMDYEVFMLSRMREEWQRTGDNHQAVSLGITRTARVITAAAAIMVVVFGAFMFTSILEIKQMGFMLGLAVLIDATIVRLLLVPALMRLMGSWNWWVPRWLDKVLPRVSTGGH